MAAGNTYTPIATTTLASATASVIFGTGSPLSGNIPSTYTDLIIVANCGNVTANQSIYMYFNGVKTGTPYSATILYGTGTSALSYRYSSINYMPAIEDQNGLSTTQISANGIIQIMNYANATTYKTSLSRNGDASRPDGTNLYVGMWRSTAAITTIELSPGSGNIAAGSTFTLYGISAA